VLIWDRDREEEVGVGAEEAVGWRREERRGRRAAFCMWAEAEAVKARTREQQTRRRRES
jgi:hypothetical protein